MWSLTSMMTHRLVRTVASLRVCHDLRPAMSYVLVRTMLLTCIECSRALSLLKLTRGTIDRTTRLARTLL